MKVKLDENMPNALADLLQQAGHEAITVVEEGISGCNDPSVIAAAFSEERMLITFDTDFGDIRQYPIGTHYGIIVFRLGDQRWAHLKEVAQRLLDSGVMERLSGGLAIIDENRIRIRTGVV